MYSTLYCIILCYILYETILYFKMFNMVLGLRASEFRILGFMFEGFMGTLNPIDPKP